MGKALAEFIKRFGRKPKDQLEWLQFRFKLAQESGKGKVVEFPRDKITDWRKPRPTTGKEADVIGPPHGYGAGHGTANPIQAQRIRQGFSTQSKLNHWSQNQKQVSDFVGRKNAEFNFLNKEDQTKVLEMFEAQIKKHMPKERKAGGGIAGMLGEPTYQDDNHRVPYDSGNMVLPKEKPFQGLFHTEVGGPVITKDDSEFEAVVDRWSQFARQQGEGPEDVERNKSFALENIVRIGREQGYEDDEIKEIILRINKKADGGRVPFNTGGSLIMSGQVLPSDFDELDPDEWLHLIKLLQAGEISNLAQGGRVPFSKGKRALQGLAKLMDEFFPGTTKIGQRSKPFPEKVQETMDLRKSLADFKKREEAAKELESFRGQIDDNILKEIGAMDSTKQLKAIEDVKLYLQNIKNLRQDTIKTPLSKKLKTWEDPDKVRAAVDDIFSTGDYKMDAQMAAEALVENNPKAFGNKLYEDLDDKTRTKIYGAVLDVVQSDLGKMLKLKRASKPTKTLKGIEETGTIDISDDEIASEFTRFMKETDPKGYAKIQKVVDDANQKLELKRFKTKGRKPNAEGGIAGGRVGLLWGGGIFKTIIKNLAREKGVSPSFYLKITNYKALPNDVKKYLSKEEFERMKQGRIEMFENWVEMAKTRKAFLENVEQGKKTPAAPIFEHLEKSFKSPVPPGVTDKDILQGEFILKNLKTKGRKLNASGGLAEMLGE